MTITNNNNTNHTGKENDFQDVPLDHDPEIAVIAADYAARGGATTKSYYSSSPVVRTTQTYPQPGGADQAGSAAAAVAGRPGTVTTVQTYTIPAGGSGGTTTMKNADGTTTTTEQYAVAAPNFYQRRDQKRNDKCCLIAGSIGITAGLVCCICFILPIIIFLITWSQMNKQYNDSVTTTFGGSGFGDDDNYSFDTFDNDPTSDNTYDLTFGGN